jgi:putative oxidoreductase
MTTAPNPALRAAVVQRHTAAPEHPADSKEAIKNFLLATTPRLLLGLVFLVGAIDGVAFVLTGTQFIHLPTSDRGLAFEAALKAAGFFWPLMKMVQLIGGLCLLTNRAPALGLALLSPIMAVIVLFHFVLNPGGIPLAVLLVVTGVMLVFQYRRQLVRLLAPLRHAPRRTQA